MDARDSRVADIRHDHRQNVGTGDKTEPMTAASGDPDGLDRLWRDIPKLLERDADWALRAVLKSGVAGYTREDTTPQGLLIRHNPDGTRQLVRINLAGPDTIIRPL
jgi:hypothetical protein